MAVWYGGGTARAPMLERDPRAKKNAWRRDLQQIRALGFNAIRCWIDWATGEPAPGRYDFGTLEVLLELAAETGLRVIVQVYLDSARECMRLPPDARPALLYCPHDPPSSAARRSVLDGRGDA